MNPTPEAWPSAGLIALLLVGMMLAIIAANPDTINHDCAQYVQTGQMILRGATPFVDIYDGNPPLVMYLATIPAGIAQVLGAPAVLVFLLCVLALVLWSAGTTWRLLRSAGSVAPAQTAAIPIALLAVSLLCMSSDWNHLGDFGQREHILVLLMTPFLVLRALHWLGWLPGRRASLTGMALGLAAGVAICLKPYFMLVVVLCEVYWVFTRRRVRPPRAGELFALALPMLVYAVWLRWFMPLPAREIFWGHILPLIQQAYNVYNNSALSAMAAPRERVWMIVLAAVIGLLMRRYRADSPLQLVAPFSLASLASVGIFEAQGKLWQYHLLPAMGWAAVVVFLLYSDLRSRFAQERSASASGRQPTATGGGRLLPAVGLLSLATVAALLACTEPHADLLLPRWLTLGLLLTVLYLDLQPQPAAAPLSSPPPSPPAPRLRLRATLLHVAIALWMAVVGLRIGYLYPRPPSPLEKLIALHSRPGDRVLVLSTQVSDPYPALLRTGRFQASRYLSAWPVPMLYPDAPAPVGSPFPYHRMETAPVGERRFLEDLAEDLRRYRPPLVVIRSGGWMQACPAGFNLLEYFQQSGFIPRRMSGYARGETVDDFTVFTRSSPAEGISSAPGQK